MIMGILLVTLTIYILMNTQAPVFCSPIPSETVEMTIVFGNTTLYWPVVKKFDLALRVKATAEESCCPKPVKLAYEVFEPAGGFNDSLHPVIYLHGLSMTKQVWKDIAQVIADKTNRRAYAFDARNHGDSEYTDVVNFDDNVDDLFHFMDIMNIEKAALVGHSMGGMTAARAALRKPEKVEMIFSEDMYVKKYPKDIIDKVLSHINLWITSVQTIPPDLSEKEAIQHAVDIMFEKRGLEHFNMDEEKMANDKQRTIDFPPLLRKKLDGTYDVSFNKDAVMGALKDHDTLISDPSGQYDGPAFFLYGGLSSFLVGKGEENIKKHFPKAELIEFEGAEHNLHDAFREKFIDVILTRLQT